MDQLEKRTRNKANFERIGADGVLAHFPIEHVGNGSFSGLGILDTSEQTTVCSCSK